MKQGESELILGETDLGTLLGELADTLRLDALALAGAVREQGEGDDAHARALRLLAGTLDDRAEVLGALGRRLCQSCRVVPVERTVRFGEARSARRD